MLDMESWLNLYKQLNRIGAYEAKYIVYRYMPHL